MSVFIQYTDVIVQGVARNRDGHEALNAAAIETKFSQGIDVRDKVLTRMDKSCVSDASGDGVRIERSRFVTTFLLRSSLLMQFVRTCEE
jgi:hypothetical protein